MNMLRIAVLCLGILALQRDAFGQYLHLFDSADRKPTLAVFQGNADWLAEQKDPKSHLHKHERLTSLWLIQHEISLAEMRYVSSLTQLRSLTIGQAPDSVCVSAPAFAALSECTWIESVWICRKDLKDSDLIVLQKLPKLKQVTIEGGNLCEAGTPHGLTEDVASLLAAIKTLEHISIRGDAGLSDRAVEELAALPKLESLELGITRCTDSALKTIASKMKLHHLSIGSPHFTEEGVSSLKEATRIDELHIGRSDKR